MESVAMMITSRFFLGRCVFAMLATICALAAAVTAMVLAWMITAHAATLSVDEGRDKPVFVSKPAVLTIPAHAPPALDRPARILKRKLR